MIFWVVECLFSTCGLLTIALIGVGYYLFESNRLAELRQRYDILRERRQGHVKTEIERLQKQLEVTDNKEDITKQTLVEIKEKIYKGVLKATDVLKAFQSRALKLHEKFNCLVEPVWEAEEDASAVDTKKKGGLLAGIPVSIKDDIGIKGYVTTAGLAKLLGAASIEDSVLVKVLKKNGAVIFARTNIPQAEISVESSNPIYGTTRNPHHPNRNPGGSSSGEGSLIGGGGSILGFGSDIGGSIRTPSNWCGCCGFKPTSARISQLGMPHFLEEPGISAAWGPLARDVDSLVLAMRALWDGSMTEFDPLSPPVKFRSELYEDTKPLKIGYYYDNSFFPATPVARRALDMAIEELKKQGHQVVEWVPPDIESTEEVLTRAMFADGGDDFMGIIQGDKVDDSLKILSDVFSVPRVLRPLLPIIARTFISERHGVIAEAMLGTGTVYKYYQLQSSLKAYRSKVTDEWKREGLDALLCPPQPFPALPLGNPEHALSGSGCMFLYNILDYPSGVVRMTKTTSEDLVALNNYRTNEKFKLQAEIKQMVSQGEGLPMGVMVGSLRWEDEKCLRVMKAVEKAADFTIQ